MPDSELKGEQAALDALSVSHARFAATSRLADGSLVVRFMGTADSDVASTLGSFLARLHAGAVQAGVKDVALDFRELGFLTSSCMKYLVVGIQRLADTDAASQYQLRLITAPNLRWQARTFEVLRQVAPHLVHIERN
jgi:hypothetical protein